MTMQNEQDMEFQILRPLTDESVMQKWFKLVSEAADETYQGLRYSIPRFPPESVWSTMVDAHSVVIKTSENLFFAT